MNYTPPPDVDCPYCGEGQNICHDDGYGYDEYELHQQECRKCEKVFGYITQISFSYEAEKVKCFNNVECEFAEHSRYTFQDKQTVIFLRCVHCGAEKQDTE